MNSINKLTFFSSINVSLTCSTLYSGLFNSFDKKFRIDADVIRGLVDSGYRGHVGVIINVHEPNGQFYLLPKGTRIAQMQIVNVPETEFEEVEELSKSDRNTNGYGSSGVK